MNSPELSQTLSDQRECDREAIHLFSSIQDHGALLAFTWPDQRIQMISENAGGFLSAANRDILGGRLEYIFNKSFMDVLAKTIETFPWKSKGRHLEIQTTFQSQTFESYLYFADGLFVLELEAIPTADPSLETEVTYEQALKDFMISAKDCRTVAELGRVLCTSIRNLTGLDRVMMYRFLPPQYHGEVIAEDRVTHAHSYLGHRFPASDIPRPARELYLRNQVRLIPNVEAKTSPLVPSVNPLTKKTLDLSDSRLRSVAKVHVEYLKNMKVGASFSVAVTDHEQLWGLITCHHFKPIHISQSQRTICEIMARTFSIQAPLLETLAMQSDRLNFEVKLKRIVESLRLSSNPLNHFFKQHRTLTEAFRADGLALVEQKLTDFAGLTPLKTDIEKLSVWIRAKMDQEHNSVLAIEDLSQHWNESTSLKDIACGVLAVRMPELKDALLLIFRREVIKTITWGGDPRKQLDSRNFQGTLNPRQSFDAWEETVRDSSAPWERFEIEGILFLREIVFDALVKKEQMIKDLSAQRIKNET